MIETMNQRVDLLLLDDEICHLEGLEARADIFGLTYQSFKRGEEALTYLRAAEKFPRGCFSDMRLADEQGNIEEGSIESLAPANICRLFGQNGSLINFRYITGNIGPRDRKVSAETGGQVLWKNGQSFWDDVVSVMRSVYVQKILEENFPVQYSDKEDRYKFFIATLDVFNKADVPLKQLELTCDKLVEVGYLDGIIEHEGDKFYVLRNGVLR